MRYIIHDFGKKLTTEEILEQVKKSFGDNYHLSDYTIIDASKPAAKCVGCFKCWLDKPSKCVFKDQYEFIGKSFMTSDEVIILSKALYGGFSAPIKRLMDRVIPGVLPFFIEKNNEQHHAKRYNNNPLLKVIFYNEEDMTAAEKEHAKALIHAVSINFNADKYDICFANIKDEEKVEALQTDNTVNETENADNTVVAKAEDVVNKTAGCKTLIIGTSPRKSASTSLYLARNLKRDLKGNAEIVNLKTVSDYKRIIEILPYVENIVFATPVYVDSIPSTTLDYLKKLEEHLRKSEKKYKVYGILNCGFYEGHQCQHALETYKLWCQRANQRWMGGIGIGGGVMIGFIRFLPAIAVACLVLEYVIRAIILCFSQSGFSIEALFGHFMPINFIIQCMVFVLCSSGAYIHSAKLAKSIRQGRDHQHKFTTVWFCPRFLFVILATTYWFVRALILHGTLPWKLYKK